MSSRTAQFAQGDLELLGLLDGVTLQQMVDRQVGRDEGQAVGQLKTFLGKRAPLTVRAQAHGGFIDQVQGQARLDSVGRQAGPGAHEVPGAQAQVFRQQQPNADLVARDFVGQCLANLPLQAFGIGGHRALFFAGALGLDKLGRVGGIKGAEFFLEAVIGDDSFDAALTNGMRLLADFLSDDGWGTIGIEETTADDHADDLIGAAVIGLGTWGLQEQALRAFRIESGQDLVIALAREIIFLSGFGWAESFALALDEHGQAAADLVVLGDPEGAARAGEAELGFGERNIHGEKVRRMANNVQ